MLEFSPVDAEPAPTSLSIKIIKNRDEKTQRWMLIDQTGKELMAGDDLESDRELLEDLLLSQLMGSGITAHMEITEQGKVITDTMTFIAHKSGFSGLSIELVIPDQEEEELKGLISYNPGAGDVSTSVQWLDVLDTSHENMGWVVVGTSLLILILRKQGITRFSGSSSLSNRDLIPAILSALKPVDIISGRPFLTKVDASDFVTFDLDLENTVDPSSHQALVSAVIGCLTKIDPTAPNQRLAEQLFDQLNTNQELKTVIEKGTRKL